MKKFYQNQWLSIKFSSFSHLNSKDLANSVFYDAFYHTLFQKYFNYDSLDPGWRKKKDELVDWIVELLPDGARVLSVGCGLGYMEQRLWQLHGERIELHVQDQASQALQWLRQVLPSERIHDIGDEIGKFDLVYISAVDYAMSDADLICLIGSLRKRLLKNGSLLIISASFLDDSAWQQFIEKLKDGVKWILEMLKIRHRGQLWGWMRLRKDYQFVMHKANLSSICDGFFQTPHQKTYWIKGAI